MVLIIVMFFFLWWKLFIADNNGIFKKYVLEDDFDVACRSVIINLDFMTHHPPPKSPQRIFEGSRTRKWIKIENLSIIWIRFIALFWMRGPQIFPGQKVGVGGAKKKRV